MSAQVDQVSARPAAQADLYDDLTHLFHLADEALTRSTFAPRSIGP